MSEGGVVERCGGWLEWKIVRGGGRHLEFAVPTRSTDKCWGYVEKPTEQQLTQTLAIMVRTHGEVCV